MNPWTVSCFSFSICRMMFCPDEGQGPQEQCRQLSFVTQPHRFSVGPFLLPQMPKC